MSATTDRSAAAHPNPASPILRSLGIPIHRIGYKHLCIAIPYYAEGNTHSLTKELYPYVAEHVSHMSWRSVEGDIRSVILDAWNRRDQAVWELYFPGSTKAPSNKLFIATLAEYIQ